MAGPPWAFAIAVGLLAVVEIALRVMNPEGTMPVAGDRGLSYRELTTELGARGAPEVVIVGSSRARHAVVAPTLREELRKQGHLLRVGNFSLAGAQAEEIEVALRRLSEAKPKPKLVVWAISARELELRHERPSRQATFLWRPSDWWRARRELGSDADRYLPEALRNEAARYWWILHFRYAIQDLVESPPKGGFGRALADVLRPGRDEPTPMRGGLHPLQRTSGRNVSRSVSEKRVRRYVGDAYQEPGWPRNYQATHLERAVEVAKRSETPLVLVELPTHPLLEQMMPPGTLEKFRSYLREVADKNAVTFVPINELSVAFEARDFREQSHVNFKGAVKYTAAIAPVVGAALPRENARAPRSKRKR